MKKYCTVTIAALSDAGQREEQDLCKVERRRATPAERKG